MISQKTTEESRIFVPLSKGQKPTDIMEKKEIDQDDMGFLSSDFINAMKAKDEVTEHNVCSIDNPECESCSG